MELSLRITDNLGLDSNSVPLSYFARAELLRFQHRYDERWSCSIPWTMPNSRCTAWVMTSCTNASGSPMRAIDMPKPQLTWKSCWNSTHSDILVDNALLDLGKLYEDRLNDPEKAKAYYERLLFEQTGSIFVPEARDRFRETAWRCAGSTTRTDRSCTTAMIIYNVTDQRGSRCA